MFNDHDLLNFLVRLSIVLLMGWIALWLVRRQNPRWSVFLTRAMAVACFLVPAIYCVTPGIELAVLPAEHGAFVQTTDSTAVPTHSHRHLQPTNASPAAVPSQPTAPMSATVVVDSDEPPIANSQPLTPPKDQSNDLASSVSVSVSAKPARWQGLSLFVLWATPCLILMLRLVYQMSLASRLISSSRVLTETEEARVAKLQMAPAMRHAEIRVSSQIACPCTGGFFRPAILVPESWFEERSDDQLLAILSHEQAHVDGRDLGWDLICRLAFAFMWFHPLVWFLQHRHRLACELVSDAIAGNAVNDVSLYRRWLAQWTISRQGPSTRSHGLTAGTFAMADRSLMMRRLGWLNQGAESIRLSRIQKIGFSTLAILLLFAVASLQFTTVSVAATPQNSDDPSVEKQAGGDLPDTHQKAANSVESSETNKVVVRIVDEYGNPIPKASVAVGRWEGRDSEDVMLTMNNPVIASDAGEVEFDAPSDAVKAIFWANADGYAENSEYVSLLGPIRVTLSKGRQIQVRVVDQDGEPVTSAIPILENESRWPKEFEAVEDSPGLYRSQTVEPNRNAMYVIDRIQDANGKAVYRFSDWLDASDPSQQDKDGTIVAKVRPGTRLRGKIDESIERPIKFGFVELCVAESLDYENRLKGGSRWRDIVEVQSDGSFEFPGVPSGSHAQVFVYADGHFSKPPYDEELIASLKEAGVSDDGIEEHMSSLRRAYLPRFVKLDGQAIIDLEPIPCEATAGVDVNVNNPAGEPIEGAKISFNPNGRFFGADLFIAGTSSTLNSHRFDGTLNTPGSFRDKCWKWASDSFHAVTTDATGLAKVRNLPPRIREGYKVVAEGFVMPIHPTTNQARADATTLDRDSPHRYAAVDLVSGEIQKRTVTMEGFIQLGTREISIVTTEGKPVAGVNVTVSELSFEDSPDEWLAWSVARFGAAASDESEGTGLVRLQVPLEVRGRSIDRFRVAVAGSLARLGFVQRQYVVLPVTDDGGVLRLTPEQPKSDEQGESVNLKVDYVRAGQVFSGPQREVLDLLVETPSLALITQLLKENDFDSVTPLKLRGDRNHLGPLGLPIGSKAVKNLRRVPKRKSGPVARVSTPSGPRVVVLSDVRPKDAAWDERPWSGFPPEAAFVFDGDTGELIQMIGGEFSASENTSSVMLVNMGGSDDHFIETSFFEKHPPFELLTRWYHVGRDGKPALTTHNFANATSWFGKEEMSDPPGEFGYTNYGFNGRSIDWWLPGTTPNGSLVPRKIYWDAAANTFIGPTTQSFLGEALYRVVQNESSAFVPFEPQAGQLTLAGGRTENFNQYSWDIVVPEGKNASLVVRQSKEGSDATATELLQAYPLQEGSNTIFLQVVHPEKEAKASELRLYINGKTGRQPKKLKLPKIADSNSASAKPWKAIRSSKTSVDLVDRKLEASETKITIGIEFE